MRIVSVTAQSFGPLAGATLAFGEGMTVIYGPNESGKSSWHAATYAALCGRPARTQSPEERQFEERHRPWGGATWIAEAEVVLADGRRVALRQNLLNRADRQAFDLDLGRDVSAEIINDGSPDAARWLGLDRRSFRATACVAQAQILGVLAGADGLQSTLQRAAATAAGGPPIEAIIRIAEFRDEAVGSLKAPTRPLARARRRHDEATHDLAVASASHRTYEQRLVTVEQARAAADAADRAVAREEFALAAEQARGLGARVAEAAALTGAIERIEPAEIADDATAAEAAEALRVWSQLRSSPDGTPPAATLPPDEAHAALPAEAELWDLARELETEGPQADPSIAAAVTSAHAGLRAARSAARRSGWSAVVGAAAVVAGAGALAATASAALGAGGLGSGPLGVVGIVAIGLGLLAALLGLRPGPRRRLAAVRAELVVAERAAVAAQARVEDARVRRTAAAARAEQAGLSPDPAELRALARSRGTGLALAERDRHWSASTRAAAATRLATVAARIGLIPDGPDTDARPDSDGGAENTSQTPPQTSPPTSPPSIAAAVAAWCVARAAEVAAREEARSLRARLGIVLGGRTITDLEQRATGAAARAEELAGLAEDGPGEVADAGRAGRLATESGEQHLIELRRLARTAGEEARAAEAGLEASGGPSVPVREAEERLAATRAELDRLDLLGETLDLTTAFLRRAQERAHRTIAPRLNDSIRDQLPVVTGGRYTEVSVDPDGLAVTVRGPGGAPRPAQALSFGTAEQVYLLLRIALAEHLTREPEQCPLLFDDVTVHADAERTAAVLDLLWAASRRHQVIVFTSQEQVRDWGLRHLTGERDAVHLLDPVPTV